MDKILSKSRRNKLKEASGNKLIYNSIPSRIFDTFNVIFLLFLALAAIYPFWDTLVISLSTLKSYLSTSFHIWPKEWSLEAYKYVFSRPDVWRAYLNTLVVTIVGTSLNMLVTTMASFVLSKPQLRGARFLNFFILFTMLFSGGLIPTYLLVDSLGLKNSLWALMIPNLVSTYNFIVLKTFFVNNPKEIEESAKMDGCTDIGVLFRIVIPITKPGLLTITLYYAVAHWNNFMSSLLYITDSKKYVLQMFLRSMLFESDAAYQSGGESLFLLGQPIKMATIMVSVIPILLAYPLFQKYFAKGITAGAVKG